ncbi:hypothetical protein SBA5_600046 [Candidatus Sulfotelmatomonas gaucii]|uniref:Uncharacterized protein n=1 Tax=Candidatus Sulfuritelmatomonas gaucii TaxID=2043161 RepID=A0A2N9LX56_9BACT|nr:hypothetical protein SBA5_600046 [Candidatus Sulfotelmatomonas gaucii]
MASRKHHQFNPRCSIVEKTLTGLDQTDVVPTPSVNRFTGKATES